MIDCVHLQLFNYFPMMYSVVYTLHSDEKQATKFMAITASNVNQFFTIG